ncbi:MAG: RHS repeat-associated core domain-containing protein [Anaerolineae bacterium]|nr:RHS repeat-associated core domain-containing protein [Anaerolineae bacterium]MCB0230532.1 RHS repeat-associated core domain-containing protein [Anaerolineae bacterium]
MASAARDLKDAPWREKRVSTGTTLTTWRFTGQREDCRRRAIGLYFYNARYYDPLLGRFTQPDTIVPNPGDPQALNRYSYVGNRPTVFVDPTGRFEQSAIEEYLQSLNLDDWHDTLKLWMADQQWWTALLAAQAGDVLTALDSKGNMSFSKFEGEGQSKLSGVTLIADVFGKGNLGTARLDDIYNGSIGLPAAVVTFNQQGHMDRAYGLNGFRTDVSTVTEGYARFHAFVFNVGLAGLYAFIPAGTTIQWAAKTIGTSAIGATVVPEVRCNLGLCNGDQWLTVDMAGFNPGTENVLPHYYYKYYSEIRYHQNLPVYRQVFAN